MEREQIFVFGSNLAGRHGAGAALHARKNFGARYGQGIGRQGMSYGIPTKDEALRTLPLDVIASHVTTFLDYARANPALRFWVTMIGTGLAGYKPAQIAPMFKGYPYNCVMPPEFLDVLKDRAA